MGKDGLGWGAVLYYYHFILFSERKIRSESLQRRKLNPVTESRVSESRVSDALPDTRPNMERKHECLSIGRKHIPETRGRCKYADTSDMYSVSMYVMVMIV